MSLVDRLIALAFHSASPTEANRAIDEVRQSRAELREAMSYEVALPGLAPDEFLTSKVLPKLAYFLDCRGVKPPASGDVFVSLFTTQGLYFVEAGPMVQLLAEARGLTLAETLRRYGADGAGDPPLLGG
ncbi:MAG: STAUR_1299 family protein [Myxococcota bacterium]